MDLLSEGQEIREGVRTLRGITEESGGMIHGGIPYTVPFCPGAVLLGNAEVGTDQLHSGDPAQAYDDTGL